MNFGKEKKLYLFRLCKVSGVCGFDGVNFNMNILKSLLFKKKYVKINLKVLFYFMVFFMVRY